MRVAYVSMLARNILLKNYQRVGVKCHRHAKSFLWKCNNAAFGTTKSFLRKRIKDCFAVALKFAFANAKSPLSWTRKVRRRGH